MRQQRKREHLADSSENITGGPPRRTSPLCSAAIVSGVATGPASSTAAIAQRTPSVLAMGQLPAMTSRVLLHAAMLS